MKLSGIKDRWGHFNFMSSRSPLCAFTFTTYGIHDFSFTIQQFINSTSQIHVSISHFELNEFTISSSWISGFNFTNFTFWTSWTSRFQLEIEIQVEIVKSQNWNREFTKLKALSLKHKFMMLNSWSWNDEFLNSLSWNREFCLFKLWFFFGSNCEFMKLKLWICVEPENSSHRSVILWRAIYITTHQIKLPGDLL
jgi:hypothetical protein